MVIKILLVEDEVTLANIVKDSLQTRDFKVDVVHNGNTALDTFLTNNYDILVLDVMLPGLDGFSLAKEIRQSNQDIPIIFLTAKSQPEDVVQGFQLGGNDYLKKPFSMEELIIRIKNLLGMNLSERKKTKEKYNLGLYTFYPARQMLLLGSWKQELTNRESEVLLMFCNNLNNIIERSVVLKKLWGDDHFFNARSMDVFISKLRKYLSKDPRIKIINVRSVGYKLIISEEN
ncbi:MAG: response regulator transcription factor [Bacteroidales bacterium]|nr:response regulator transcription factor [Bacteroidales bacterium]